MSELSELIERINGFAAERDWDQYHSPKNLSMALIAEAAELVEHFQWLTEEQSDNLSSDNLAEVRLELADIFVYLLRLSERLGVDLVEAAHHKIGLNEQKYPAQQVKGSSKKYNEYKD